MAPVLLKIYVNLKKKFTLSNYCNFHCNFHTVLRYFADVACSTPPIRVKLLFQKLSDNNPLTFSADIMFQNNPLLAQLKQQLHSQTLRVEGLVKGTEKGFGFLEVDGQKSYFIPPPHMKKVMHGDRVTAAIHTDKEREIANQKHWSNHF